jgi:hypothetical protein
LKGRLRCDLTGQLQVACQVGIRRTVALVIGASCRAEEKTCGHGNQKSTSPLARHHNSPEELKTKKLI